MDHRTDLSGWFSERSLLFNLSSYLSTWSGNQIWWPQMTFHLCVAGGCFVLSWLLFEPCTKASTAGMTEPTEKRIQIARTRAVSRVRNDALAWKVWKHHTGGALWFWLRVIGPAACVALITLVTMGDYADMEAISYALVSCGIMLGLLNVARLLGLVFNVEIRENTLSGLLMLPLSRTSLVVRMLWGLVPAFISASACFGFGMVIMVWSEADIGWSDLAEVLVEPMFLHFGTWLAVTLMLGLLLSVRLRYGGMLIAIVICGFAMPILLSMCSFAFLFQGGQFGDHLIFGMLMVLEAAACVFLWMKLVADIDRAGA